MATVVYVEDKVTTTATHDVNGTKLASFVRSTTYDVIQVGGRNLDPKRIVIGIGKAVTAAVWLDTLTVVSSKHTPEPPPVETPPVEPEPPVDIYADSGDIASRIQSQLAGAGTSFSARSLGVSAVQTPVVVNGVVQRYTTYMSDDYKYMINSIIEERRKKEAYKTHNTKVEKADPSIVQNAYGYPNSEGFSYKKGRYEFDYYMDYDKDPLNSKAKVNDDMDIVRKASNIEIFSRQGIYLQQMNYYNKFKLENNNDRLSKSFAHVFFIRPDCKIFKEPFNVGNMQLQSGLKTFPEFYYAIKHCPDVLRQLTQNSGYPHQFALYLSNKARSFEIADEYLTDTSYGQGLTGYKIPYGKDDVESKTVGEFSIRYVDDRDLHVYNLHKLWKDYISYVFRGKVYPKTQYITNKILDYATCVYYILTAEDGETIIFWSKYWGVFPIESPSSGFSFAQDNTGGVKDPELNLKYKYAWKEDFNPLTLIEFNAHSAKTITDKSSFQYVNPYQEAKAGTGYTWSQVPFIETFSGNGANALELPYTFKLRFRPIEGSL